MAQTILIQATASAKQQWSVTFDKAQDPIPLSIETKPVETNPLSQLLIDRGVSVRVTIRLAEKHPADHVRRRLAEYDSIMQGKGAF